MNRKKPHLQVRIDRQVALKLKILGLKTERTLTAVVDQMSREYLRRSSRRPSA